MDAAADWTQPTMIVDSKPDDAVMDAEAGILIVDDRPENLVALRAVLEPLGERLECVSSGERALRALLREDFAVILLDVRMHGIDGLQTAQLIRARPRTRETPIVFLTAEATEVSEIARAYESSGVVDYLVKPFEPEILRAKVRMLVKLKYERAERWRQAQARAAAEASARMQLEADLKASAGELAASRGRLIEMAHAERRRLERDLHDGVQQHLVGLRIKLDLAAEAIKLDPEQGEQVLASVGRQLDEVLQEVRSLARGIYPSLLSERGVVEALRAAGRNSPIHVEVRSSSVGRYAEEVEVAVYFCCLEALQNVCKHAGPDPSASIALVEDPPLLRFEVSDSGVGFDPRKVTQGAGLVNMRDRLEAVGGGLEVVSRRGRGTTVRGYVPAE